MDPAVIITASLEPTDSVLINLCQCFTITSTQKLQVMSLFQNPRPGIWPTGRSGRAEQSAASHIVVRSPNRSRCLDEQDGGGGNASTAKLAFVGGLLTSPGISWWQIRAGVSLSTVKVPSTWPRRLLNRAGNGASRRMRWGKEQGCLSCLLVQT